MSGEEHLFQNVNVEEGDIDRSHYDPEPEIEIDYSALRAIDENDPEEWSPGVQEKETLETSGEEGHVFQHVGVEEGDIDRSHYDPEPEIEIDYSALGEDHASHTSEGPWPAVQKRVAEEIVTDPNSKYFDPTKTPEFHRLVSREQWGAQPPKSVVRNEIPCRHVRYTFTWTPECTTPEACEQAVRDIQKMHMDRGCSDIMYNFLVGGDNRVYEGRGWDIQAEIPKFFEDLKRETTDIAFIGNYALAADTGNDEDRTPFGMTNIFHDFLRWALRQNHLEIPLAVKYHDFGSDFKKVRTREDKIKLW